MNNSKTIINIVIVILVLVGGFVAWRYFTAGDTATEPASGLQAAGILGQGDVAGQSQTSEFVILLNNLRSVDLQSNIFSNPAFANDLQDFTTPLPDRPQGRSNPFAPVGN